MSAHTKAQKKCGKTRYRDAVAAKLALATIQNRDDSNRPKMERRAYRCPNCGGWHLTAKGKARRASAIYIERKER